jgi:hypothetical protein
MYFWTVSIVLDSKKLRNHNVSETGSVPVLRCIKCILIITLHRQNPIEFT